MIIKRLTLGEFDTNCYVLGDEETKKCAIIDPADDGERIANLIKQLDLEPVVVLLTHSHFDHILGFPKLQEIWPSLPVYCHKEDCPEGVYTEIYMGRTLPTVSAFEKLSFYDEGDVIEVGNLTVKVLHTPGHSKGSVVLQVEDVLFTGDTLFCGSMGRTDFEGGSEKEIMKSLARLSRLDGNYKVYPGHEGTTTLDKERETNSFMKMSLKY